MCRNSRRTSGTRSCSRQNKGQGTSRRSQCCRRSLCRTICSRQNNCWNSRQSRNRSNQSSYHHRSLADIESRLIQLDGQFQRLLAEAIDAEDKEACNAQFAEILAEQTALKKQKEEILQSSTDADRVCTRMKQAEEAIENTAQTITEWSENAVRQIVERVTVLSADEILVRIKGGAEIKQRLER